MQSKKITYKDIKILREKINQQSGVEVIKEHWVNPRVNITTGKTISMVVSLYLNSKFLYDEEFVKELKKELHAFTFSFKKERNQLVLLYDIKPHNFDNSPS